MKETKRTHYCGTVSKEDNGKVVVLNGWVQRVRQLGSLTFILLRDREGITQIVLDSTAGEALKETALKLKPEYCIAISGKVHLRAEKDINREIKNGDVEVTAEEIEIFNPSLPLPFSIEEVYQKDGSLVVTNEETRLKYRYLDLRRERIKNNIILRSKVLQVVVNYLTSQGFIQIETPTFIKSTPEGARDFLVPSRTHPGSFYSLPQSPQLYKQLLMVSGFDRYFQIARCYRDEDARGDRQPEFTQIDMELSFTTQEEVLEVTEGLMQAIFLDTLNYKLPPHFKKIKWEDSYNLYGTDKPDLRYNLTMQDGSFLSLITNEDFTTGFPPFTTLKDSLSPSLPRHLRAGIKVLVIKGGSSYYSRKKLEKLEELVKTYKVNALYYVKVEEGGEITGGVSKFLQKNKKEVLDKLGATSGDLILITADKDWQTSCIAMGALRRQVAEDLNLYEKDKRFIFAWIVDFPYFAWNTEENKWETEHHMFTLPKKEYWETLESDTENVKGDLYDLVLNGYELASGSLRINRPELQNRIFNIVGYTQERAKKAFGFLVEAFKYGAPPHGGIAPGLDRLIMIMCGEQSIHEVIAFPKNNTMASPLDNSPSSVDEEQLKDLGLTLAATN